MHSPTVLRSILLSALACFSLAAPRLAYCEEAKEPAADKAPQVVAEVNTKKITKDSLDMELRRLVGIKFDTLESQQLHTLQKQALNKMIERELLLQAAVQEKSLPDQTKVQEMINDVKKNAGSQQGFEQFLKQRGFTETELFEGIKADLGITTYIADHVVQGIDISDKDAQSAFETSPERFATPEEVHAKHILLKLPQDADEKKDAEVKKRAEEVLAEAKKEGADFAKLAREYSEGPTNSRGGDLGYFTKNQMVPPFAEAAFSLKPGEVSDLVKTRFGYHIIKVEDRRGGAGAAFADVKAQVKRQMLHQARQSRIQKHVGDLRSKAKVIVYID